MRMFGITTILLLTSAAIGLPTAAAQVPSAATPEETVHAFHTALAAGDSATALALLAPDGVIFESGGVEASRDEYRSHHLPADMEFAQAVTREVTSQQSGSGGEVAWVLTESRTVGTFRERPVHSRGVETMLLLRTLEGWRIAHIHWSSRRVPSDP